MRRQQYRSHEESLLGDAIHAAQDEERDKGVAELIRGSLGSDNFKLKLALNAALAGKM